jgi:hypothetical protein
MGFSMEFIALGRCYMKFDVVPIRSAYRGIGRSLAPQDFRPWVDKRNMDYLLEVYFDYITDSLKPECQETFERMLSYCRTFRESGIPCEVIVYDSQPLENAYGKELQFLGIDIVLNLAESLLENGAERLSKNLLNENLLCLELSNLPKITKLCDHGGAEWCPCWVYHVL